jgi:hypothetical protein
MLNMLALVVVTLISGTQFGYIILLLIPWNPLLNGFLNKILHFVGLGLRRFKISV